MTENNPYQSPQPTDEQRNAPRQRKRIEWEIIPAILLGLLGCAGFFGLVDFLLTPHPTLSRSSLVFKSLVFLTAIIAYFAASRSWIKRHWLAAIFLTVAAYVLVVISMTIV